MSEQLTANIDISQYDFLDFGASHGGSIEFARRRLGGRRGLGVDKNPRKVESMRKRGYECIEGDITALEFPPQSVRFVVMSHFLEHLPDLQTVQQSIACAARVATDFLFLQGPFFDADEFLRECGLKFYWSDWHGHPCHLTTQQLREILGRLGLQDYVLLGCRPVVDSFDASIHPVLSPPEQHEYQPGVHPEKPFVQFSGPLYKDFACYVRLRALPNWEEITQARRGVSLPAEFSFHFETHISGKGRTVSQLRSSIKRLFRQHARYFTAPLMFSRRREAVPSVSPPNTAPYLTEVGKRLLLRRRWAFLRYVHLRRAFLLTEGVRSVLAVGCGHGYAELALAIEFPQVSFHLTDIQNERSPNYGRVQKLVQTWRIPNVTFGIQDILEPVPQRYDMVTSIEVLEHIEDHTRAAATMQAAAEKYVFALVSFADKATNADAHLRASVYERQQHYRVGYDAEDLQALFPRIVVMQGCYWRERGHAFRTRLHGMSNEEIIAHMDELRAEALLDIRDEAPTVYPDARGVWILAQAL